MDDNRRQALIESLSTNEKLNHVDIEWIVNKALDANFCETKYAYWVLLSNLKLTSGLYAISFNETLENIVHDSDPSREDRMYKLTKMKNRQLFPELYNNVNLSENEKKAVEGVFNRELHIVMSVLKDEDDKHLLPYGELPDKALNREQGIKYEEIHDMICFTENDSFTAPYPDKNVLFYDRKKECVPKIELLKSFAMGKYMNPVTGEKINDNLIYSLLGKYSAEINLIKGSLDSKRQETPYEIEINKRRFKSKHNLSKSSPVRSPKSSPVRSPKSSSNGNSPVRSPKSSSNGNSPVRSPKSSSGKISPKSPSRSPRSSSFMNFENEKSTTPRRSSPQRTPPSRKTSPKLKTEKQSSKKINFSNPKKRKPPVKSKRTSESPNK